MAKALSVLGEAEAAVVSGDGALASEFERVTGLGIKRVRQALELGGDEGDAEFLFKQAELGVQLIRAKIRVDQGSMQARSDDAFVRVLEKLAEVKELPAPRMRDDR